MTDETQTTESTQQESATEQVAPQIQNESNQGETQNAEQAAEVQDYTPNFKFKVMEKEHEIPEFMRSAIKNADHEKQAKEIYEKALGLEFVKPRFQEKQKQYQELHQNHQHIVGQIEDLRTTYQRGDFDGFFQKLNIPQEKVLNWLVNKLQYQELPQEQRQILDAQKSAEQRAWEAESQLQAQTTQYQQHVVQAKSYGLEVAMQTPEVKSISSQYDQARQPGAFRDLVISHGDYVWRKSNGTMDLSPDEAIKQVMSLYGISGNGAATKGAQQTQTMQTPPKEQIPVIPNVSGRSASPVGTNKPRSIDDLKKLAASM